MPEPARALGYRGMAAAYLGDARGVPELERVLDLLIESGAGRDAAIVQNNLAIARYPLDGVAASLATLEAGIGFCRQRGLVEAERVLATTRLPLLLEVGRADDALAEAAELAAAIEATGQVTDLVEVRAVDVAIRAARGERPAAAELDWIVETAHRVANTDTTAFGLSCVAVGLASESPDRARALLSELEHAHEVWGIPYYVRQLPALVRAALTTGDGALAERLAEKSLDPHYPLDEHTLCAVRAHLAEHAGDHAGAAALYADAADRWQEFGNVPESAHALLGQGRCMLALGQRAAEVPLAEARALFASLAYKPALAETEALLTQTTAAAS